MMQTLNDGMDGLCVKIFMNLTKNVKEITEKAGRFSNNKKNDENSDWKAINSILFRNSMPAFFSNFR